MVVVVLLLLLVVVGGGLSLITSPLDVQIGICNKHFYVWIILLEVF